MAATKCVHEMQWQSQNVTNLSCKWYEEVDAVVNVALQIAERKGQGFVAFPFDTTLEGECLGADIQWGINSIQGKLIDRKKSFENIMDDEFLTKFKESVNRFDAKATPRLKTICEAIVELKSQGKKVVFNLTGPITLLSALIGFENLIKVMRKKPEQMERFIEVLAVFYRKLIMAVEATGADLISYADPLGNPEVMGKIYFEKWSIPIQVQQIQLMSKGNLSIHVCGTLSHEMNLMSAFPYPARTSFEDGIEKLSNPITGLICIHAWK